MTGSPEVSRPINLQSDIVSKPRIQLENEIVSPALVEKMRSLRVVVNGQGLIASDTYKYLIEDGHNIVGVIAPKSEEDQLRIIAGKDNVPVFGVGTVERKSIQAKLKELDADVVVMVNVARTIPDEVLKISKIGTIEYHPSLLPEHRGRHATARAIRSGEKETGVTAFWVEPGIDIDAGPILLQAKADIPEDATAGSFYGRVLAPLGSVLMRDAVRLIALGREERIPQDESRATYEPPLEKEEVAIDFSKTAKELHNDVRSAQNSPGAWTRGEWMSPDEVLNFYDSAIVPGGETILEPGVIYEINERGLVVSARDGLVIIGKVQGSRVSRDSEGKLVEVEIVERGPRMPAAEFAVQKGIKPGSKFSSGLTI